MDFLSKNMITDTRHSIIRASNNISYSSQSKILIFFRADLQEPIYYNESKSFIFILATNKLRISVTFHKEFAIFRYHNTSYTHIKHHIQVQRWMFRFENEQFSQNIYFDHWIDNVTNTFTSSFALIITHPFYFFMSIQSLQNQNVAQKKIIFCFVQNSFVEKKKWKRIYTDNNSLNICYFTPLSPHFCSNFINSNLRMNVCVPRIALLLVSFQS